MWKFVLALSVLWLAGCRSDPVNPNSAAPTPAPFVYPPAISPGQPSAAATFTRDSGGPPGSRWIIYLDGSPVARIGKGESFTTNVPVGDHILGLEPDAKMKVLQVMNISQTFATGKHYYFRAMFTGEEYRLQPSMGAGDIR